jgi:o-succinylbenzoate synthase
MGSGIHGITVLRTKMPLKRPYHLSLVTLDHFESVLVRIQGEGWEGFGETTDVPGYFHETPDDAWRFIETWGPKLLNQDPGRTIRDIRETEKTLSFAATPLLTALEEWLDAKDGRHREEIRLPLLGVVQGETVRDLMTDAEMLQEQGFGTLKFKVGFEVKGDLERLRGIQKTRNPGVRIRIDANQGYDYDQARSFLTELDPEGIELFEQPLATDAWDEMSRLSEIRTVPLMLDEAISSEEDLDRTIETGCAQAVKFKLMKCGSRAELTRLIQKARSAGLKVILGNGVALDLGCRHEALVLKETGLTGHAGEMNGFLKCKFRSLEPELVFEGGHLIIPAGEPRIRWDVLSRLADREKTWGKMKEA